MSINQQGRRPDRLRAGRVLTEVLARTRANPLGAWPSAKDISRLDPECLPAAAPSFSLRPGATIFTLGSCFARSIEEGLAGLGYRIPAMEMEAAHPEMFSGQGREVLNLYTPPAIWQQLAWCAALLDRGAEPTLDDIRPSLVETGSGRLIDLQANPYLQGGDTPEEILEARRRMHALSRQAFEADAVVITLGYVECWWDRDTGDCIEFDPRLARTSDPDRWMFRRIDHGEAYDYVRRTIELLRSRGDPDILITTSPVPLHRTFTTDDVIVANSYSKAVLRAVAGDVAQAFERVDYFPSYESVTLSRPDGVWEADRRHVAAPFVARIMGHVAQAYVGDDGGRVASRNALMAFCAHVRAGEWGLAEAAHDILAASAWEAASPEDLLAAAELEIRRGRPAEAAGRLAQAQRPAGSAGAAAFDLLLRASDLYRELDDAGAAALARERAFEVIQHNRTILLNRLGDLLQSGRGEAAAWLLNAIGRRYDDDAEMLSLTSGVGQDGGLGEDALRLALRAAALQPVSPEIALSSSGIATDQGRPELAIEVLLPVERAGSTEVVVLRRLVKLLNDAERYEDAEALISRRLERNAGDSVALELLARARMRQRRPEEALGLAEKAVALGNGAPGLPTLIERARAAASRIKAQA